MKNKGVFKIGLWFLLFLAAVFLFKISSFALAEEGAPPKAAFHLYFMEGEKSVLVNDAVLPPMPGSQLPFQLYASNVSSGAKSYAWFIKLPQKDYELVSTEPNPVLTIHSYGVIWIKLRINETELLSKEVSVRTHEYRVLQETVETLEKEDGVSEEVYRSEKVEKTVSTYISGDDFKVYAPRLLRTDTKTKGKSDFKISYRVQNKYYKVNDQLIPEELKTLPYTVTLTNMDTRNRGYVWYIKLPGQDYVWMDNAQNAAATVWHYGTTYFKLVINDDFEHATTYHVTANPPGMMQTAKATEENTGSRQAEPRFKLTYVEENTGKRYDVSDARLPDNATTLPYTLIPVNLSKGESSWEWLVKKPGSPRYEAVSALPIVIDCYGPVSVKLRINGREAGAVEKTVAAFFEEDASLLQQAMANPTPDTAKADFRILMKQGLTYDTVTGKKVILQTETEPLWLHLENLSAGNTQYDWRIRLPGKDYVAMAQIPSPVAQIWQEGKVYFKLTMHGDESNAQEHFVEVFSAKRVPRILSPQMHAVLDKAALGQELTIQWHAASETEDFLLSVVNSTLRSTVLEDKLVKAQASMTVSTLDLKEGCTYLIKVRSLETGLEDVATFSVAGRLFLSEKPKDGMERRDTAVRLNDKAEILSRIGDDSRGEYYAFDTTENTEMHITLRAKNIAWLQAEILDASEKVVSSNTADTEGQIHFSKILKKGQYTLRISKIREVAKGISYTLSFENRVYHPEILLLYVGYGYKNERHLIYPSYTDADLDKMFAKDSDIGTREFLIVTGRESGYGLHEAVPEAILEQTVEGIKIERSHDKESLKMIQEEIRSKFSSHQSNTKTNALEPNPDFIPKDRNLKDFADASVDLALRLIQRDSKVKVWFSFPVLASINLADKYTKPFQESILYFKQKMEAVHPSYWTNNVAGFYYSQEDIPGWYTPFELQDKAFVKTNPAVKSMKALSVVLREQYDKMFLWIPYYGEAPGNVQRIGYVANQTDIFDYVIVQPSRMFDSSNYFSQGTGDAEIQIETEAPMAGKALVFSVQIPGAERQTIKILDPANREVAARSEAATGLSKYSFTPRRGLYSIIVEVQKIGGSKEIFTKSLYVEAVGSFSDTAQIPATEHWQMNIPAVLRSSIKNQVMYPENAVLKGVAVAPKTSKTVIGFEMEIDTYAKAKPENIDFVPEVAGVDTGSLKLGNTRAAELETYYHHLSVQKALWYREYLDAFQEIKNTAPVAFYAGERNELMDGLNVGIKEKYTGVYDAVKKFFEK